MSESKHVSPRYKGSIVKLNASGWGFIHSPELKFERIYFHWSALKRSTLRFPQLKKHMEVTFEVVDQGEDKGFRAIYIEVTNESAKDDTKVESTRA